MKIIFLTYVNRSGSTYLANLLSSSDEILACPEGDMLVSLFLEDPGKKFEFDEQIEIKLSGILRKDPKLKYWGKCESYLQNLDQAYNNLEAFIIILINYKNNIKPGANHILFKAERLIYLVKKITGIHTNHSIKFLSIIRDPRGVFASQKKTCFPGTMRVMSNNPGATAIYWRMNAKICSSFNDKGYLIIRFEDLILKYSETLHKLTDFLGMDLSGLTPKQGDLYRRLPKIQRGIHKNLRKKPIPEKNSCWKTELSVKESTTIQIITYRYLELYGYQVTRKRTIMIYLIIVNQLIIFFILRLFNKIIFHLNNSRTLFKSYFYDQHC